MVSYRDLTNSKLMNSIVRSNSMAFGDRAVPVTIANMEQVWKSIQNSAPQMNSFVNALINRIGMVIFEGMRNFDNPLAEFKTGRLAYGSTVQEISLGLLKAHGYDPDDDGETLFARETLETKAIYHTLNRQEYYKVTVNREQLQQAFLQGPDSFGLVEYVEQTMGRLNDSDQYDEMLYMLRLFKVYKDNGGFFYIKAGSDQITDEAARARDLLRKVRATAGNLKVPSRRYNAGNMPVYSKPDDMVFFTTPETNASIDVDALAAAFNIERAQVPNRVVEIPSPVWPFLADEGINGILTTRDFFRVFDNILVMNELTNPQTLNYTGFLHHWQVISCSLFVPAIAFTNALETITIPGPNSNAKVTGVNSVKVYPRDAGNTWTGTASVPRGQELALDADITVTNDGEITDGVLWEVRSNSAVDTVITRYGTLKVSKYETANTLTVRAYMATDPTVNSEITIAVTGPVVPFAEDNNADYVSDDPATVAWAATHTYVKGDEVTNGPAVLLVTKAGTSGGTAPVNPAVDATVTDGTVTWKRVS